MIGINYEDKVTKISTCPSLKSQELHELVLGAAADGSGEGIALGVHHGVEGLGGRAELPELQVAVPSAQGAELRVLSLVIHIEVGDDEVTGKPLHDRCGG